MTKYLIALALAAAGPVSAQMTTVEIVNETNLPDSKIYVLLTGENIVGTGPLTSATTSVPLAMIPSGTAANTYSFLLSSVSAGKFFFSLNKAISAQAPPSPITSNIRFDTIELTLNGPGSVANLTSVDFFGLPFKMETFDASGKLLQQLTTYSSPATIVGQIRATGANAGNAVVTTDGKALSSSLANFARILSPNQTWSDGFATTYPKRAQPYPSLAPYIDAEKGKKVRISGTYNSSLFTPNQNPYSYSGTLPGSKDAAFVMKGTALAESAGNAANYPAGYPPPPAYPANSTLTIAPSTLPPAIFTANGPFKVGSVSQTGQVADNTVYSAIYRDLIAGYGLGYVGGRYGNNSANWYNSYPYADPYGGARPTPDDGYYNKYSAVIYNNSDAYGFPFSDLLALKVQAALGGETARLRITLLPDSMLDAPVVTAATTTKDTTLKLTWTPVAHATGYKIVCTPPQSGKSISISSGTTASCYVTNLNAGTPYSFQVMALNSSGTSAATRQSAPGRAYATTTGTLTPITGPAVFAIGVNMPPIPAGETDHYIIFNGVKSKAITPGSSPTVEFPGGAEFKGQLGATNSYVFQWVQGTKVIFSSIYYITFSSTPYPGTHYGRVRMIDRTYLDRNAHLPSPATSPLHEVTLGIQLAPVPVKTIHPVPGA